MAIHTGAVVAVSSHCTTPLFNIYPLLSVYVVVLFCVIFCKGLNTIYLCSSLLIDVIAVLCDISIALTFQSFHLFNTSVHPFFNRARVQSFL